MPPYLHEWNASSPIKNDASHQIWPEPLDTPGYVPQHLKRHATSQFPILELIQRLLYRLKPNGTSEVEKILALIGLYQAIRPVYRTLKDFCIWAFTVQITIPETDPLAKEVLAWIGSEVIIKTHSRSAMLVTSGTQDSNTYHSVMLPSSPDVAKNKKNEGVLSLPPVGTRLFWVGFRPFIFSRRGACSCRNGSAVSSNMLNESGRLQNEITLTTLGWSLEPLQNFAKMCHDFKAKHITGTTTIYFAGGNRHDPYGNGWQSVSKAARKLDTIDMDEKTKQDIVRDAEYYYSDESRTYFADCGIPYRRGYLFYGPPGTGKSSFSAALAGHLRCDIYHISLANGTITDDQLHRLFLGLPRKCIVVIEDIDCAGIGREHADLQGSVYGEKMSRSIPAHTNGRTTLEGIMSQSPYMLSPTRHNSVTLSGLLNAIDGNTSQEGRLLIMTSNDPDSLDTALTRPGRIDKKVYFGKMGKSAGRSIFKRLIGRSAMASNSAFTAAQIDQWADEFVEHVPPDTFSPAEIQNFLQDCRGDPMKALNDIEVWVANNRPVRISESSASELDYSLPGSDVDEK